MFRKWFRHGTHRPPRQISRPKPKPISTYPAAISQREASVGGAHHVAKVTEGEEQHEHQRRQQAAPADVAGHQDRYQQQRRPRTQADQQRRPEGRQRHLLLGVVGEEEEGRNAATASVCHGTELRSSPRGDNRVNIG